jgi:hypothetical protein
MNLTQIRESYNSVAVLDYQNGVYQLRVASDVQIPEAFLQKLAGKMLQVHSDNPQVLFAYPEGYIEAIAHTTDAATVQKIFAKHTYQMQISFSAKKRN